MDITQATKISSELETIRDRLIEAMAEHEDHCLNAEDREDKNGTDRQWFILDVLGDAWAGIRDARRALDRWPEG